MQHADIWTFLVVKPQEMKQKEHTRGNESDVKSDHSALASRRTEGAWERGGAGKFEAAAAKKVNKDLGPCCFRLRFKQLHKIAEKLLWSLISAGFF